MGIAIARWGVWGWLAITTIVQRDELIRPLTATAAVLVALAAAVGGTLALRSRPRLLSHPIVVVGELLLGWSLLVVDGWVFEAGHTFQGGQNLAGQWPLVAVIAAATAFGPNWGAGLAVLVATGRYVGAVVNGVSNWPGQRILSLASTAIFFAVAGIVFGAMSRRLRTIENEVALRRARDEVASTLHDGVLQTLALVDRRTRTSDPELAAVARASDRELRSWLFHGVDRHDDGGTVEERLRRVADRISRNFDLPVTVSVLDDEDAPRHSDEVVIALINAAGEALTNAAKHAEASRVVVFADTDDEGRLFISVRDDGKGFDPATTTPGRGTEHSIRQRVQAVGGRVDIMSAPGAGTDVKIWSQS
jgi:signal transduction histidine kinase